MPIPKWEQPLTICFEEKTNSNHYYLKTKAGTKYYPSVMISKLASYSYVVSDYRAPRYSFEWKKKMVLW
jgi:hypothetical protein